jgi:hypothetical protein
MKAILLTVATSAVIALAIMDYFSIVVGLRLVPNDSPEGPIRLAGIIALAVGAISIALASAITVLAVRRIARRSKA